MKAKKLLSVALAATLVIGVCSGCSEKTGGDSDVTTVTMWTADSHSKRVMEGLVNDFNQTVGKEQGIRFEYIIKENDLAKQVEVALSTGQAPDLFGVALDKGVQNDYIAALDDLPGGKELIAKYDGRLSPNWHTYNGKTYRLPTTVTTMGLIYNKDMFKKAGIVDENGEAKPPETVDELVADAKKLTNEGSREYGIVLPMKWSAWFDYDVVRFVTSSVGYSGYNPVDGSFDYSGYKPLLEALMQIKADESYYPGAEGLDNDPARARFAEGNIGMKVGYSWDVGVLNDQFPAKCDWGVAPIPTYSKDVKYMQPTQPSWSPCINKKSAETKDAEKIMTVYKWLVSDEHAVDMYKAGVSIPYDYEIIKGIEPGDDAKKGWKEFGDLLAISTDLIQVPSVDTDGQSDIKTNFINKVWTGEMSIDDAISEANKVYNEGLKKYASLHPDYDMSLFIKDSFNPKR